MKNGFLVVMACLLLQACGTIQFDPAIYPLAENKIENFPVMGKVEILSFQNTEESEIIHSYGGTKYQSNYKVITDTMVAQAKVELKRHGQLSAEKSIKLMGLKVTNLNSRYIAFYWKGTMTFEVKLGEQPSFEITVNHSTGAGPAQDLSGSIADGVVALYKDQRVLSYLAN